MVYNKILKRLSVLLMTICLLVLTLQVNIKLLYARDSNGVTVTDFSTAIAYGMHIDHYSAFNPTSATYIYNEAGGSTATSGEVILTGNTGPKTLVISVPTLGSTSLDFRLEGKVGTSMTTWANIYTINVSSPTTTDIIIPISEYITSYRLGVKVNTNGADNISCSTSIITHK